MHSDSRVGPSLGPLEYADSDRSVRLRYCGYKGWPPHCSISHRHFLYVVHYEQVEEALFLLYREPKFILQYRENRRETDALGGFLPDRPGSAGRGGAYRFWA